MNLKKYRKAKKKFVRKRVHKWAFKEGDSKCSFRDWEIEARHDGRWSVRKTYFSNKDEQLKDHVLDLGFVNGFWKAREMARKNPNNYTFSYYKVESF